MTSWSGRPVLVTGGTGFIGSWLVARLLGLGARVTLLVNEREPGSELIASGDIDRCRVVDGRLEDLGAVERAFDAAACDTVFHLAARALVLDALEDPLATFESNVRGSYNLLEACRRRPSGLRAVVVASSDKAYGDGPSLPYTESMPVDGRNPYDVSKSCTDLLARAYAHTWGTPVAIARCGNVYGGGDVHFSRIVPGTIRSALRGERPVVRSDGTFTRDYLHVDDVVDAYLALGEGLGTRVAPGDVFNFAPGNPVSVLDLVGRILRAAGREDLAPQVLGTARSEIHDQYLDATRARNVLGWEPRVGLDEGLARTVAWYRRRLEAR